MNRNVKTILITLLFIGMTCAVVCASGGGEHEVASGVLLKDFLYRVFNFAIVIAILVYFLRKPLKSALSGRTEEIEKALAEAKKVKVEAEAKFAEYDQKLATATDEIAEISAAIRREGEVEKKKIIASAKALALEIEKEAGNTAELEIAKARTELQREAVKLAVGIAEELLKKNFTKEDDTRFIDEYMQKVGELH